jgi:GNAT superfamily N-acetyltransferase
VRSEIRTGRPADLGAMLSIDPVAAAGDAGRADLLQRSVAASECLVHLQHGSLTGFVVTRPAHFFGRDFVELLVVAASSRRAGTGRALLRAAFACAGTEQVFTSASLSNAAMRGLLASEGWSFSGELAGLDAGDPELVFFKSRPGLSQPG